MPHGIMIGTVGATVPEQGRLMGRLWWTRMTDDVIKFQGEERHASHDMRMDRITVDLVYGLGFSSALMLSLPLIRNQSLGLMHASAPNTLGGSGFDFGGDVLDPGDVGVFLKTRFLRVTPLGLAVAGAVGVEVPTGSDDRRFDEVNLATSAYYPASDPGRWPVKMQPGNGAVDYTVGLLLSQPLGRGMLDANGLFKWLRKGFDDVDQGDILMLNAGIRWPLLHWMSGTLEVNHLAAGDDRYPNARVLSESSRRWAETLGRSLDQAGHLQFLVLEGTVQADPITFLTPGVALNAGNLQVHVAVRLPISTAENGIVPDPMPLLGLVGRF